MADTPPDESASDDGPDYRQLSFVALAAFALVLAAFFAPATGQGVSSPEADPETPDPEAEPGSLPDVDIDWHTLLEWVDPGWIENGDGESELEETGPDSACAIYLNDEPTPGSEVTALVLYRGEPLADVPVWFNDRRVGETDDSGRVTGEVPYVEELVVRIETDDHPECAAVGETAQSASVASAAGAGTGSSAAQLSVGTSTAVSAAATAATTTTATPAASSAQDAETTNGTVEYEVDGAVEIAVRGETDPGETVIVAAAIEGEPMREATVTVDGETIGETNADGTATLEIPDDGTDEFELGVARGDFAGTTTVDVRLLEVSLSPGGLAPIPGSPGLVEAEIGGEPVEDATVSVDGETLGTTDADGVLPLELPRDPTTAVTVSVDDRTATASLVGVYGDIALVLSLAVAGLAAVASRTHGARGPVVVLGTTAALLFVLVVEAFYGPIPGGVALLAVAGVAVGVALLRSDRAVASGRPPIRDAAIRFLEWCLSRTLALVAVLERGRSHLAAARAWVASLPRSGTALGTRLAAWITSLPERAVARGRHGLEWLRRRSPATIAAVLGAVPLIGGGYVVDDRRGAAIVALVLAIAAVLHWRAGGEPETDAGDGLERNGSAADTAAVETKTDDHRSFRDLWRAFARRVAPRGWHRHTPGEIQRDALEQGYPREPVTDLTALFREVEYGRRPLSSAVRDRADHAYAELERARSEPAGSTDRHETRGESESESGPGSASERTRGDELSSDGETRDDEPSNDDETGGGEP